MKWKKNQYTVRFQFLCDCSHRSSAGEEAWDSAEAPPGEGQWPVHSVGQHAVEGDRQGQRPGRRAILWHLSQVPGCEYSTVYTFKYSPTVYSRQYLNVSTCSVYTYLYVGSFIIWSDYLCTTVFGERLPPFDPFCPHKLRNVLCFVWFDSVIVVGFDIVINFLHFHLLQNYINQCQAKGS